MTSLGHSANRRFLVPPSVVLQDGIVVDGSTVVDVARRSRWTFGDDVLSSPDVLGAHLVALGAARLRRWPLGRGLDPRQAVSAVRWSFVRRHGPGGPVRALVAVTLASRTPALVCALTFGLVALVTSVAAGDLAVPLTAWLTCTPMLVLSLVAHEWAHLVVLRGLCRDRAVGAVHHTWWNVWVVGPALARRPQRLVALVGPLCGAAVASLALVVDVAPWACLAVALAHLVNLGPTAPDGRLLWTASRDRAQPTT
jgi:hypothetical protein